MTFPCATPARTTGLWFKSSKSKPNGNECVEVRFEAGLVQIRDSKDRHGPVLSVPAERWAVFLDEAVGRALAGANPAITIVLDDDGGARLYQRSNPTVPLSYTPGEWEAFVEGIRGREFELPTTVSTA